MPANTAWERGGIIHRSRPGTSHRFTVAFLSLRVWGIGSAPLVYERVQSVLALKHSTEVVWAIVGLIRRKVRRMGQVAL
jgi:hypothetical protein